MRLALLLVLALLPAVLSADVYCGSPDVFISSMFPQTTLMLEDSCLVVDWAAGTFSLNGTTKFTKSATVSLPPVTVNGQAYLLANGGIAFSYPAENLTYCSQTAYSAPSLCPHFQRITTGPWLVNYRESGGSTVSITITYTAPDANSNGQQGSFLGAEIPFTYSCIGTCSLISNQVPQPSTLNVTVRRSNSSMHARASKAKT
jgi:hypothetical protein